jgi:PAS domain S-box-containing protein
VEVARNWVLALLDSAPDAMVCVDRSGLIALVNSQTERLFGYRREELIGQPLETLVPEAVREVHQAHRAQYLASPHRRPMGAGMELSARRRDGSAFRTEISLSALDTDEGFLVLAAVRDTTERVALQAERERLKSQAERGKLARQMADAQRLESLGALAGGVAHDFNNLLAVISSYATFISEEAAKGSSQVDLGSIRSDVEQITLAAGRAAELTHQLLAFARRDVVKPRPLDLNDIIASVEQLLVRTLGEHVILRTSLAPGLCPVLADPGQIERVLVNLAVNARDAMPSGGTLMMQTSTADIDEAHSASRAGLPPGRYACMKISDTGVGMPAEVIERAFDPFFTTKAKGEGTGLGLATVYGIVTRAGGYVQLYSEPGVGTTVTIMLPDCARPVSPGPAAEERPSDGRGETVLLVEDEPAMLRVTDRILTRRGYNVIAVGSGKDAIECAASHPGDIHVLLTDVIMPRMLGKEVAERVLALRPGVRVLFMSGHTQGILDSQGIVKADVALIEKPFTEARLLAVLAEVIATDGPEAGRLPDYE